MKINLKIPIERFSSSMSEACFRFMNNSTELFFQIFYTPKILCW